LTFLRSDPEETENRLVTVDLSGTEVGGIAPPGYPATDGSTTPEWRFRQGPPLVTGGKADLGAFEVINEVDLDSEEIGVFAEYADQYSPLTEEYERVFGFRVDPGGTNLAPVGFTVGGDLLVWDASVNTVLNQTGGGAGPSGAFLLSSNDDVTPLFETSVLEGGYLAPLSVGLAPGGTKLVFVWLDAAELSDNFRPKSRVSVLDLENAELPVDPRGLPEIWTAPTDVLVGLGDPIIEWSADDRISIQAFGVDRTLTYVLQLEER
jgi:hypothetical protein